MAITSGVISRNNILEFPYGGTQDIGGTDLPAVSGSEGWVRLSSSQEFTAYLELIAFEAADTLDTLQIEEAKDKFGLDSQLLPGKLIAVLAADAVAGSIYVLECKGSDLTALFGYVRLMVAETGNSGPDTVVVSYTRTKGNGDLTTSDARI